MKFMTVQTASQKIMLIYRVLFELRGDVDDKISLKSLRITHPYHRALRNQKRSFQQNSTFICISFKTAKNCFDTFMQPLSLDCQTPQDPCCRCLFFIIQIFTFSSHSKQKNNIQPQINKHNFSVLVFNNAEDSRNNNYSDEKTPWMLYQTKYQRT